MNNNETTKPPQAGVPALNAQLEIDTSLLMMYGLKGLEERGFKEIVNRLKRAKVFVLNAD
jgi:hypothetical protein